MVHAYLELSQFPDLMLHFSPMTQWNKELTLWKIKYK